VAPGCLYAAEEEAREIAQTLIRDAGYEPEYVGGLDSARALEDFAINVLTRIAPPVFYRFAPPGEL
jgi:predicted dinucleotide-binding enzyme